MSYIRVKKPSLALQESVAKRQGLSMEQVKRYLRDPRGDRIYFYPTKRGPEIAIMGFI